MISRDVKVLDKSSDVYARMIEYSNLFDELCIVVMTRKSKVQIVSTERLKIYNASSYLKIVSFLKTFFILLRLARRNKGRDTWITSQDPFESGLLAFFVAKFTRSKLQLQFHTDCFNIFFIKHSFSNYFRALVARIIVRHADSIRVVSERIRFSLLAINPKLSIRIYILPIWTDVNSIKNKEVSKDLNLRIKFPEFSKLILIMARLESEKNIDLAIHSFHKMLRFDESLGLVIAGSGSKGSWLKDLVRHLGVENNVKFVGWVSDTSSLYKTSDVLLITSFYEGYGLNMVESVACGTSVVSTDVGVASEIGAIIVPYDAGHIALKTIETLNQNRKVEFPQKFLMNKSEYLELFKKTFTI